MKPEQIAYEWFARQWANGNEIGKDEFLMDRTKWDDMQTALFEGDHSMEHDEVKSLVRNMDKRGMLGGVAASRTYWDQLDVLADRAENRKQTGHPGGEAGIIDDLGKWAGAVNGTRPEGYYEDIHWRKLSRAYRESQGWRCELCHRRHLPDSAGLVTHHIAYEFPESGEPVWWHETSEVLMAVCASPCHQLADLARYFAVGRIDPATMRRAMEPLFANLGREF